MSVPIFYAVIVKLFQFEEISLVYVSPIPCGFFDCSTLEKIESVYIAKMKEKNFRFEKNCSIRITVTFSDSSRQAELKYIIPDQRK